MKALFVESGMFEKHRGKLLSDDEYRNFQKNLLKRPLQGDVIQGTGGLSKIRIAAKGHGKRGGARVIYYYLDKYMRFYLRTIYGKGEMADLNNEQKQQLQDFMEVWKNEQS